MHTFHDKTGRTRFQKSTIKQYVEQEWTMFSVEIALCHPIAIVGVHVFEKVGLQNIVQNCQEDSKKSLLQAIDPDVDKHAQINEIVFLKTASLHSSITLKCK